MDTNLKEFMNLWTPSQCHFQVSWRLVKFTLHYDNSSYCFFLGILVIVSISLLIPLLAIYVVLFEDLYIHNLV